MSEGAGPRKLLEEGVLLASLTDQPHCITSTIDNLSMASDGVCHPQGSRPMCTYCSKHCSKQRNLISHNAITSQVRPAGEHGPRARPT